MKIINLKLNEKTIDLIKQCINHQNAKDIISNCEIHNYEIDDFVSGCINYYLEQIKAFNFITSSEGKLQNNLKKIMKEHGYSQKQLSAKTGIDPGSLSNILSNRSQPSMDFFLKIWNILGRPQIDNCFYRK